MHVIIVGCGRLGSGLAHKLSRKGIDVTVIDKNTSRFAALGKAFPGKTLLGVEFDKEVLEQAGIQLADAIISCTESDEINALVARISRNIYRVPRVIARLYDPRKAAIYNALGIQTISTTEWGIERATQMLSYSQMDTVLEIGNSTAEMVRIEVPELLIGRPIGDISRIGEFHVVYVLRANTAFLPVLGTIMERHDILYIAVSMESAQKLKTALGLR